MKLRPDLHPGTALDFGRKLSDFTGYEIAQDMKTIGADGLTDQGAELIGGVLVQAAFSDGGKNFGGYPFFEALCFWFAAAKDCRVKTGFVDNCHFLIARGGTHNLRTLLVIVERPTHVTRHAVFQSAGNVSSNKPWLIIN